MKDLKNFTDEELRKELERRAKRRRGPVLGYRAICYGDEYNYGGYADWLIGDWRIIDGQRVTLTKALAKSRAEEYVAKKAENGGYVYEIYKDTPKEDRVH